MNKNWMFLNSQKFAKPKKNQKLRKVKNILPCWETLLMIKKVDNSSSHSSELFKLAD